MAIAWLITHFKQLSFDTFLFYWGQFVSTLSSIHLLPLSSLHLLSSMVLGSNRVDRTICNPISPFAFHTLAFVSVHGIAQRVISFSTSSRSLSELATSNNSVSYSSTILSSTSAGGSTQEMKNRCYHHGVWSYGSVNIAFSSLFSHSSSR